MIRVVAPWYNFTTAMNSACLHTLWPLLKQQVRSLHVPWLDALAQREREPFKVLISCILSLRTQDRTTEEASLRLFRHASTPEDMAGLSVKAIEKEIYPVGFYRVKAQRIREMSREIATRYHGKVPDEIEELLKLKGVGRKTANLVVTLGYDKPGICVDTHVHRITNRWGLVRTKRPDETEFELRKKLPKNYWKTINGLLVAFGQNICKPLSPLCSKCAVSTLCERRNVKRSR